MLWEAGGRGRGFFLSPWVSVTSVNGDVLGTGENMKSVSHGHKLHGLFIAD